MRHSFAVIRLIVAATSLVLATAGLAGSAEEPEGTIEPGPVDPKEKVKPGPVDKDAPKEFQTTKSGLKYRILRKSDRAKPAEENIVVVHYKGWLDDRTVFESSYRSGRKAALPLSRVMMGWTEGMRLVGNGGMIELEVPPELGYGSRGKKGQVPPNARLHFIIELFEIREEIKLM